MEFLELFTDLLKGAYQEQIESYGCRPRADELLGPKRERVATQFLQQPPNLDESSSTM